MAASKPRSIAEAIQRFRDAAIRKAQALKAVDDHKDHRQMRVAYRYLEAQGTEGRTAFDQLLFDDCPEVASWVSAQLLSEGRREAIPVVRRHVRIGGLFGFSAGMVLREFKAGRLA